MTDRRIKEHHIGGVATSTRRKDELRRKVEVDHNSRGPSESGGQADRQPWSHAIGRYLESR